MLSIIWEQSGTWLWRVCVANCYVQVLDFHVMVRHSGAVPTVGTRNDHVTCARDRCRRFLVAKRRCVCSLAVP